MRTEKMLSVIDIFNGNNAGIRDISKNFDLFAKNYWNKLHDKNNFAFDCILIIGKLILTFNYIEVIS